MIDEVLYGNSNWQPAIDAAVASTKGGHTGTWRVWSLQEGHRMMNYSSTSCLSWWTTGNFSSTSWTRTESPSDSTQAIRFNNTGNGLNSLLAKAGNQTHLRTRICYFDDELQLS